MTPTFRYIYFKARLAFVLIQFLLKWLNKHTISTKTLVRMSRPKQAPNPPPTNLSVLLYFSMATPTNFLTRKSTTGTVPEGSNSPAKLEWKPAAKAALKKAKNYARQQQKKAAREQELVAQRTKEEADWKKILEEAKKFVIKEDMSLPKAERIKLDVTNPKKVKLGNGTDVRGTRVRIFGRVHRERRQKEVMFITLRNGYGLIQVIFTGPLAKTYDALTLTRETSMEICGELKEVPPGAHAPNDRELHADHFKIHNGEQQVETMPSPTGYPRILNTRRFSTYGISLCVERPPPK